MDVALPPRVVLPTGDVASQRMLSATPGGFSQLQASVRSRLVAPAGALSSTFLELAVGQDVDLRAGSLSETWARGALRLGWLIADVAAGFRAFGAAPAAGTPRATVPSRLDAFTELSTTVTALDKRGDNVHASFISIGAGGSPRLLAGLEPFFDPRPFSESAIALGQVGAVVRLSGATLGYDALFYGRDIAPFTCPNGKRVSSSPHVYQHQASLVWDSPCKCWKALVAAVLNECDEHPRFTFLVDFSAFAGGGIPR
jgi:LPS-assembly protein